LKIEKTTVTARTGPIFQFSILNFQFAAQRPHRHRGCSSAAIVRITSRLICGLAATFFLTVAASAEYYVVPEDAELIESAEAIAVVNVKAIHSAFAGEYDIVTNIDVEPELVLKGNIDRTATLRIVEPGGEVGKSIKIVSAAPRYWVDNRALVFLKRVDGGWRTWGASLGKFDFVRDAGGRELAVRWAAPGQNPSLWTPDGQPHFEKVRDARLFLNFIRNSPEMNGEPRTPVRERADAATEGIASLATGQADYFVEPAGKLTEPSGLDVRADGATSFPPSAYTLGNFRWLAFDQGDSVTFRTNGTQSPYDAVGAAQRGLAAWTNDPGSNVRYVYGGTTTAGFEGDRQNTILFNQSSGLPEGAIAYAQWFGDDDRNAPPPDEHEYKNETFITIVEGDVIVRSNLRVSQRVFDEAITHELGHTLGFRHSDQGQPQSTQAVMNSVIMGDFGASLGPWDIDAVRTVYGSTTTNPSPGAPANLVATATSETTIVITWSAAENATGYQLERSANGSGFTQIATPTGTSFTDAGRQPDTTYVYRVRATGDSGTTPSAYSNREHATTVMFTDDPLIPNVTTIKAVHLTELRTAVNAVRVTAGLAPVGWTDPNPLGATVKAVHILELRSALTPALAALGKSASYTDALGDGSPIRAVHFQEIRNLVK
jgi:hypothetical protein